MKRSILSKGFILHRQPYFEQGFLCSVWTLGLGRLNVRFSKQAPELFRCFEVKLREVDGFFQSTDFRYVEASLLMESSAALTGLYLNELLHRLVPAGVADRKLYGLYQSTLLQANEKLARDATVRYFEQRLLESLGKQLDYQFDSEHRPIVSVARYEFYPNHGFVLAENGSYPGDVILDIHRGRLQSKAALATARRCQQSQLKALSNGQTLHATTWRSLNAKV